MRGRRPGARQFRYVRGYQITVGLPLDEPAAMHWPSAGEHESTWHRQITSGRALMCRWRGLIAIAERDGTARAGYFPRAVEGSTASLAFHSAALAS